MKQTASFIIPLFLFISFGTLSSEAKKAEIKRAMDSIFSGEGEKNDYSNYRPVNVISNGNESAGLQSYDATGVDRFFDSPCYGKIGFSPTWDRESLEKQYSDCEMELFIQNVIKASIIFIIVIALIVIGLKFRSYIKRRRDSQNIKQEKEDTNKLKDSKQTINEQISESEIKQDLSKKLSELRLIHKEGLITDEEYERTKNRLLGDL